METLRAPKVRNDSVSDGISNASFSSRYELICPLNEGGTSRLYLVKDKLCGSSFAVIKLIRKDASHLPLDYRLAVSEFSAARQISHPNIINIYNVHRTVSSEYLVMEYIEGASLKDFLSRENLNYEQVVALIKPVVNALAYLHGNGVVHSDVKPSNIIISAKNTVKLIDLANCRQDSNNKNPNIKIKENSYFGFSERYSSPQIINDIPATTSDDVYSLALIIYEMLTGSLPSMSAKEGVFRKVSISKPQAINYWQWRVLKKAIFPAQNERHISVKSFFDKFCQVRYLPHTIAGSAMLSVCLLLLVGHFSAQWENDQERYLQYQTAQKQLDTIQNAVNKIRKPSPEQRYLHLDFLNDFDEFSRRIVLNEVYEDVVLPITKRVNASVLNREGSVDLQTLVRELNVLGSYYVRSKDVSESIFAIETERNLRLQGVLIAANNLIDSRVFDDASAIK